ncbi:MAG: phosphoribosylglycinamide formyltransferase [Thiotrichales bacterium]|nr:phosphoribosylglycinamide formyltransferase [Thiotrichales bacterium]
MMRLGFLASGRGSNMQAIIDACESGRLPARPVLVISNNADAIALVRAAEHGLETAIINQTTHPGPGACDGAITQPMQDAGTELVILAGYMKKIGPQLLAAFPDRIINIHPSLLPRHGGQGMYGMHVHNAVIAAGDDETGVTIHLVNNEYDRGRILAQHPVQVEPYDTAETLAERVLAVEHDFYVDVLGKIISGDISLQG